ncbi:MAG: ATP-binding protein [Deferribacterales bacterium]
MRIRCAANTDNLADILNKTEIYAEKAGLSQEQSLNLLLLTEELAANVINYAYESKDGGLEIETSADDFSVRLTVMDSGKEFNPLLIPDPDTAAPLQERKIGGLGIFLVKQFADSISYRREDGMNITSLILKRDGAGNA